MMPGLDGHASLCIVRSEPLDGGRLYSVLTMADVVQQSAVREQHTRNLDEVLRIVMAFLTEMDHLRG